MASKQLGKLRQWAGEVISSKEKTTVSEEFLELEQDIQLRRKGVQRLDLAFRQYSHVISKQKESDAVDDGRGHGTKLLPIDALGMVMISHGEDFGVDSAFGTSLINLGRAHCRIATLQESYALTLQDTILASLEKVGAAFKEYEALKRKLDGRRLSLDAAVSRLEKARFTKKEKERKEAEEEHEKARLRYDETSEELRAHMHSIQDNEIGQWRDMTSFLDLEINFVKQYLAVLRDAKAEWPDERQVMRMERPQESKKPLHKFASGSSLGHGDERRDSSSSNGSNATHSLKLSDNRLRKASDASTAAGTIPSRSSSRASRPRTESSSEKDRDKVTRRLSVAGWASAVTGLGKQKFAELKESDDTDVSSGHVGSGPAEHGSDPEGPTGSMSSKSSASKFKAVGGIKTPPTNNSPRIMRPLSLRKKRIVRALQDFNGSPGELTFKTGDEITVLTEVVDGWWMGELRRQQGLFPSAVVEALDTRERKTSGPFSSDDDALRTARAVEDSSESSDFDEDHSSKPLDIHADMSPFYGHVQLASSTDDGLAPHGEQATDAAQRLLAPRAPLAARSASNPDISVSPAKRAPPPPPPRRSTSHHSSAGAPSSSGWALNVPPSSSVDRESSPFDDS